MDGGERPMLWWSPAKANWRPLRKRRNHQRQLHPTVRSDIVATRGVEQARFSAKRTLQLAQALYDRYKLLTYPRTDSKCLPEDYIDTVQQTVKAFSTSKASDVLTSDLVKCSKWIIDNDRIVPSKRIFNTAKVSDHFAIIPTGKFPTAKLDDAALKLYHLVLRRFLAVFFPPPSMKLRVAFTDISKTVSDHRQSAGRSGILEVYGRKAGVAGDKDELVRRRG